MASNRNPGAGGRAARCGAAGKDLDNRRGCGTTVSRRDKSGRSSVTVKKKRSAETELLMLGGSMPIRVWCSWNNEQGKLIFRAAPLEDQFASAVGSARDVVAAVARTAAGLVAGGATAQPAAAG